MSEHDKTGGPAFPTLTRILENYMDEGGYGRTREVGVHVGGMTLRDYFAAKAMQGICAHPETWGLTMPSVATRAYEMADEMLKARKS